MPTVIDGMYLPLERLFLTAHIPLWIEKQNSNPYGTLNLALQSVKTNGNNPRKSDQALVKALLLFIVNVMFCTWPFHFVGKFNHENQSLHTSNKCLSQYAMHTGDQAAIYINHLFNANSLTV